MRARISLVYLAVLALANPAGAAPAAQPAEPEQVEADAAPEAARPPDESAATPDVAAGEEVRAPESIEEIVVTGRKREERLQDVPLSIQAFSESQLEQLSLSRVDEVGLSVPNLKFDATNGSNSSARIYIRGIGQDDPRSVKDPGVGIYVDGIYLPRLTGGLLNMVDLERVEVLRGPQGTLYGRNTIGGVVNLITQKPAREFGVKTMLRAGTRGLLESRISVDVPITLGALEERVFTRFTVATATDDGYTRNAINGDHSGDNKLLGGRLALRALPTERLTLDVVYDFQRENEEGRIAECLLTNPFSSARFLSDNWTQFSEECQSSGDKLPFSGFRDPVPTTESDTQFAYAIASLELGDFTIRSLSSWRQRETSTGRSDLDFTPSDFLGSLGSGSKNDAWSQEINLNGTLLEGALEVTGGLYWDLETGEEDGRGDILRGFLGVLPGQLLAPTVPGDPLDGLDGSLDGMIDFLSADAIAAGALTATINTLNDKTHVEYRNRSYAAYTQLTYTLLDSLHVTGGLRYTRERKRRHDASEISDVVPGAPPQIGLTQEERFSSWTPMANVAYDLTEDMMVFGGWARGWKSGGFVEPILLGGEKATFDALGLSTEFDEEIVDSYEIGFKSSWLDRRLIFNATLFWNDYEEIQLSTIGIGEDGTLQVFINNAGEAVVRGGELETRYIMDWGWLPGSNARLLAEAGVGYIHAEFKEFEDQEGLVPPPPASCTSLKFEDCGGFGPAIGYVIQLLTPGKAVVDKSGLDFKNTPEWNWNVAFTYGFDLAEIGRLSTRVSWSYQSAVFYNTDNSPNLRQGGYGLFDARISLDTDLWQNTTIALWGKNLLDKEYIDGGFSLGDTVGTDVRFYGRPRTYGIELIVRY